MIARTLPSLVRHPLLRASLLALGLALASACGEAERAELAATPATDELSRTAPTPEQWVQGVDGLWMLAPDAGGLEDQLRALEAIGYASGFEEAPATSGVTVYDRERARPGFNFYTSGHAPVATLMDMDGNVRHTWSHAYDLIPGADPNANPMLSKTWRRARLLPDGGLLAIHDGLALVRLDRDSKLLWSYTRNPHHDLDVGPEGEIYVLTRRAHLMPRLDWSRPILEDFVTVLDPDGNELRSVSIVECFENSKYRRILEQRMYPAGDILHTNSVEWLDGRLEDEVPAFARGNLLISMRHTNAIAVVDLAGETIVWAARGNFKLQHDPTILPNGNLLLFDNAGNRGSSQVLEFDLRRDGRARDPVWVYRGEPPESFFTVFCGTSQRLPNGNTLITESCRGRAFEVTPAGEIVWQFVSPERAGEKGELIAALFEVVRVPPEAVQGWLD